MTDTVIRHCGWSIMEDKRGLWVAFVPGEGLRSYPTLKSAKSAAEREPKAMED